MEIFEGRKHTKEGELVACCCTGNQRFNLADLGYILIQMAEW